jgi:16S rRNA (guanine1207-N2)-methyltransferase
MPEAQYFATEPGVASRPTLVELVLPDATVTLTGDRGVFSADRIDSGTLTLLKTVSTLVTSGNLLDLGCGYGPIAVTLARRAPAATVWAVDVNRRAVDLTAANAVRLGLRNVRAAEPATVPPDIVFDEIWSNPPIRIGKVALHELLDTWLHRLAPTGRAWLVVHKHLGSDSLAAWLHDQGFSVDRQASKHGYRVLEVRPPDRVEDHRSEPAGPEA